MDPDKSWTCGTTLANHLNIKMRGLGQKKRTDFLIGNHGREREEKEVKSKTSFFDPQSFVGRNSSSKDLKFIYSMRATHMYQKGGISPKIQRRRFEGNQGFRV